MSTRTQGCTEDIPGMPCEYKSKDVHDKFQAYQVRTRAQHCTEYIPGMPGEYKSTSVQEIFLYSRYARLDTVEQACQVSKRAQSYRRYSNIPGMPAGVCFTISFKSCRVVIWPKFSHVRPIYFIVICMPSSISLNSRHVSFSKTHPGSVQEHGINGICK